MVHNLPKLEGETKVKDHNSMATSVSQSDWFSGP